MNEINEINETNEMNEMNEINEINQTDEIDEMNEINQTNETNVYIRRLNMSSTELIFIVEEDLEGGFNARALGESIFVQGDTFEDLKINIRDALDCHYDKREDIPPIIRLHIVRDEVFAYG